MAVRRATALVWMMVVAVMMAENGRVCMGLDMEEAKGKMMDGAEKAKEGAEAWATWVKDKLAGTPDGDKEDLQASVKEMTGNGWSDTMTKAGDKAYEAKEGMKEGAEKMKDKAGASAQNVKEGAESAMHKAGEAASGGYSFAQDKANGAKEGMKEGAGKVKDKACESAQGMKEGAERAGHNVGHAASTGYSYAQDKGQEMKKGTKEGMDKAGDKFYDETSHLGGAYGDAKDSFKEQAKAKYESAKEKASDMAGKVRYHTMPVRQ